jgi:RHS repeat-associated protein
MKHHCILARSGTVQAAQLFNPYGSVRYSTGTMPTEKGFTGQRLDPSGLSYFNARYYDSSVGQFTSADSAQGPNRYEYVGGNPETITDPTGQFGACAGSMPDGRCLRSPSGQGRTPQPPKVPPATCRRVACTENGGGSSGSGVSGPLGKSACVGQQCFTLFDLALSWASASSHNADWGSIGKGIAEISGAVLTALAEVATLAFDTTGFTTPLTGWFAWQAASGIVSAFGQTLHLLAAGVYDIVNGIHKLDPLASAILNGSMLVGDILSGIGTLISAVTGGWGLIAASDIAEDAVRIKTQAGLAKNLFLDMKGVLQLVIAHWSDIKSFILSNFYSGGGNNSGPNQPVPTNTPDCNRSGDPPYPPYHNCP